MTMIDKDAREERRRQQNEAAAHQTQASKNQPASRFTGAMSVSSRYERLHGMPIHSLAKAEEILEAFKRPLQRTNDAKH